MFFSGDLLSCDNNSIDRFLMVNIPRISAASNPGFYGVPGTVFLTALSIFTSFMPGFLV
jgi:hypothetical protein